MRKKKGQLTAFVLVAFVILIAIVLLTVMYVSLFKVSISNKQFVNDKVDEVKTYINDCITNGLIQGLKTVGAANIQEYMKSINCNGVLGQISGINVDYGKESINAVLKDK